MIRVAIIPARGGSKGIKNKNLKIIAGHPLIWWTIQSAIHSNVFDKIIVTTDSEEIMQVSRSSGSDVIERPKEISSDESLTSDAICHVIHSLSIPSLSIVVTLQPTSPLRNGMHIHEAITKYEYSSAGSLISVCRCEHHPMKTLIDKNSSLMPILGMDLLETPRQKLPQAFRPNGAIYAAHAGDIISTNRLIIPAIDYYEMEHLSSIDIDTVDDLEIASKLLEIEKII